MNKPDEMQNAAGAGKGKHHICRRWWPWATICAFIAAFVICLGPWRSYSDGYKGSDYAEATFARIEALSLVPTRGPLQAGVAVADITPALGEPLAGYSARRPKGSEGALDRLYAKAISLSNGPTTVTIVSGDILLFLPELRDAVLARSALLREDVYFTSTHTHSGPGGYSSRWIDQVSLGRFDKKILARLADAFADVIKRSRENMTAAEIGLGRDVRSPHAARELVQNRLDSSAEFATVNALNLYRLGKTGHIASLLTFSAHPTCLGRGNHKASGDYPGVVQREIERRNGGVVLFAAGAMGSMAVRSALPRGPARAEDVGRRLAELAGPLAMPHGARGESHQLMNELNPGSEGPEHGLGAASATVTLATAILDVDLPPQQFLLGRHLRLSPIAASYLHNRRTYIHILRINEAVLLGMPADYSGELAAELERWAIEEKLGVMPVVTSFNGDYIGYLLPRSRYGAAHYESRRMNLFGPWCGEYFNALSRRLIQYTLDNLPAGQSGRAGEVRQGNSP
ncbi:MAG: neutral/alkaline non-lysosomal ceramidase N-terminal domain-containing protein [Phycisphaerae bacterium]|nr:neutral/alkaline non-lysosomal ceramidase N-terminal domain-containing protein [Phycisphaerae bacterium]